MADKFSLLSVHFGPETDVQAEHVGFLIRSLCSQLAMRFPTIWAYTVTNTIDFRGAASFTNNGQRRD